MVGNTAEINEIYYIYMCVCGHAHLYHGVSSLSNLSSLTYSSLGKK